MKDGETNILLVEDDVLNQFIARNLLQKWGMKVSIAKNGVEAINQIVSKIFDIVLMDIQMPVMNGFESTRQIREMEDPYFKTIPIIAFTASGMTEAEMMIESGMNDIITKPFIAEEMKRKISKYISALRRPLSINFDLILYLLVCEASNLEGDQNPHAPTCRRTKETNGAKFFIQRSANDDHHLTQTSTSGTPRSVSCKKETDRTEREK